MLMRGLKYRGMKKQLFNILNNLSGEHKKPNNIKISAKYVRINVYTRHDSRRYFQYLQQR
ncbi:hypothetical protein GCM10022394_20580 [Zobellella aerophila]|uniref:Transposase n=1 Tax=Zobellella aerophila TaxID=870480 RepID=A0ABP6VVY3_9GAMM